MTVIIDSEKYISLRKDIRKVGKTNHNKNEISHNRVTMAGVLITMGVVYGDIGTSPLYVMKSIMEGNGGLKSMAPEMVIGSISLVFWTITLLTTIKYVCIALNADNQGEGGIFSLFVLVRKMSKFLIIPAMIGGAALLADGMLTPAVTVTTAIEGLRGIPSFFHAFGNNQNIIILITCIIIVTLFLIQRFGTSFIGKAFGPIMLVWFTFLALAGLFRIPLDLSVLKAFNPYYAIQLLFSPQNKLGLFILGSVFLATTGAEALYSDLGHVGKKNIRFSWIYVCTCLMLNYLGQGAWILSARHNPTYLHMEDLNPFYSMLPSGLTIFSVILATTAAIIASQALISGSYTLVSEAIKLKMLPRLKISYPSNNKGQLYMPAVNYLLMFGCLFIVFYFRTSAHMESAYGLAITVTMLMTTILLYFYLLQKKVNKILATFILIFFGGIESIFFISSAAKFAHGGYIAVLIACLILAVMAIWTRGNVVKEKYYKRVPLENYVDQLHELRDDESIPLSQTNLVFLTDNLQHHEIGRDIMYSILDKRPKRAKVYWFVNVYVTNEPYTMEYLVDMMDTDFIVNVQLRLGFRVSQDVNVYLRQIVNELMAEGKLPEQPQKYSTIKNRKVGDFSFVLLQEELPRFTSLNHLDKLIMQLKLAIKKVTVSPARWFGLEYSDVIVEHVPLFIEKARWHTLKKVDTDFH